MDNNLILHIGLPKTGTTSLQHFFIDNKKNMNEAGIDYPAFTQQLAVPTLRNGSFLFKYLKALVHNEDPNSRVKDLEKNITMEPIEVQLLYIFDDKIIGLFHAGKKM